MVDQIHQRLPVPLLGVKEDDRLGVPAQLLPGDDLEDLLKRAKAPGHGDDGLCQIEHHPLAGVHVGNQAQVRDRLVADLDPVEKLGNDPDDVGASREGTVGNRAHHPGLTTAVDQPEASLADHTTEGPGGGLVARPRPAGCPAVDADAIDFFRCRAFGVQALKRSLNTHQDVTTPPTAPCSRVFAARRSSLRRRPSPPAILRTSIRP